MSYEWFLQNKEDLFKNDIVKNKKRKKIQSYQDLVPLDFLEDLVDRVHLKQTILYILQMFLMTMPLAAVIDVNICTPHLGTLVSLGDLCTNKWSDCESDHHQEAFECSYSTQIAHILFI